MRISSLAIVAGAFICAAGLSLVAARFAVTVIERSSEIATRDALDFEDLGWAEVHANGLQLVLHGLAPDEAERFDAISVAGGVVDPARVIDRMTVKPAADIAPPKFSAKILRNESGISVVGLIPSATDRAGLIGRLSQIDGAATVTDLLETAAYPVPENWNDSMAFAVSALAKLPRSKVAVNDGVIEVTAIAQSAADKARLERELKRDAPAHVRVALDIAAPRPVITPFTLRFLMDEDGGRFDACSAATEEGRRKILRVAEEVAGPARRNCTVGMGVPSPRWAEAVEKSLRALRDLGGGSITFSDADITLVALQNTDASRFDHVVGELQTALPPVFALHAVLPEPEVDGPAEIPEFVATLSPEGQVQLRGRVNDALLRETVDSFARAQFGSGNVHVATRITSDLSPDWPLRVLSGLEALGYLENGALAVTPDSIALSGVSFDEDATATIAGLFAEKLGGKAQYDLKITYREPPKTADNPYSLAECSSQLREVQHDEKILFEPGSAKIAADSATTLNRVADILTACGPVALEIQGHTDSQGRETMNKQLSQERADAVLADLRARRLLTANYTAVGYGEENPIASNDTAEGREANRRIDFVIVRPEPEAADDGEETVDETALDASEEDMVNDGAEATDDMNGDLSDDLSEEISDGETDGMDDMPSGDLDDTADADEENQDGKLMEVTE
ncbi:OmpA family protein [Chachezhania sediminis]|uniref:OmpA family protein n=1 Tax=Chachezhania sediminis TaxID=2599291 RepID=UPI00131C26F1|nr:OmpA family protein [Chachezhania sediminis]